MVNFFLIFLLRKPHQAIDGKKRETFPVPPQCLLDNLPHD